MSRLAATTVPIVPAYHLPTLYNLSSILKEGPSIESENILFEVATMDEVIAHANGFGLGNVVQTIISNAIRSISDTYPDYVQNFYSLDDIINYSGWPSIIDETVGVAIRNITGIQPEFSYPTQQFLIAREWGTTEQGSFYNTYETPFSQFSEYMNDLYDYDDVNEDYIQESITEEEYNSISDENEWDGSYDLTDVRNFFEASVNHFYTTSYTYISINDKDDLKEYYENSLEITNLTKPEWNAIEEWFEVPEINNSK